MRKGIIISILLICVLVGIGFYFYHNWEETHHRTELVLYGNVDVRQVDLGFRVNGRVESMPFQEGDWITRGVLMGTLEKQPFEDQVSQAAAALQSAKASLMNAEKLLTRRQELLGDGSVSKEDYENAFYSREVYAANVKESEAALGVALTNMRDTHVYAPSEGSILTRIREPGTVVVDGAPIYTLSLIDPIWVRAFVSEQELGLIYPDMPADIYTDTKGGPIYKGHIGFISPVAEFTPKTVETTQLRTDLVYRLRVIVDNPDQGLRQGMPVTVKLPIKQRDFEETK